MGLRGGFLAGVCAAVALCGAAPAQAQEVRTLSDGRVAQVGDVAITVAEYERWLAMAVRGHFGRPLRLVAPAYAACVAVKRERRARRGRPALGAMQLRGRCRRDHAALRKSVVEFLIQSEWIEREAAAQGVSMTAAEVEAVFRHQRDLAFPNRRGFRRYLRESGMTVDAILHRIRIDELQVRVTRKVTRAVAPVTDADVARFRAKHRRELAGIDGAGADRRIRKLIRSVRQQRAVMRFAAGLRQRGLAATWCAPGYATPHCGASHAPIDDDS